MKKFLLSLLLSLSISASFAQELLCRVSVDASRIQSDKQIFEDMRKSISDYMNFNKFTSDEFEPNERIKCNLQIIVNDRPSSDYFTCTANIQLLRPTLDATYETITLNLSDRSFNFSYVPLQQLQFTDNVYNDNLTALLSFYAYIILGTDYDSFSRLGGTQYFVTAQNIANLAASSSSEGGWRSTESTRNKYWLIENILNNSYRVFREATYKYHRKGMDLMESNPTQGRKAILECVQDITRLNAQNPTIILPRTFIDAKNRELEKVFQNAFINDKKRFLEFMRELDPANISTYERIMSNK